VLFGALTAFLADTFIRPRASEGDGEGGDTDELKAKLAEISRELRALRDEVVTRANPPNDHR
jgi:hypothetical protein